MHEGGCEIGGALAEAQWLSPPTVGDLSRWGNIELRAWCLPDMVRLIVLAP